MKSRVDDITYRTADGELLDATRVVYYEERKYEDDDEVHRMFFVKVGFDRVPIEGWDSNQDLEDDFYPHVQEKMRDSVRRFVREQPAEKLLGGKLVGLAYRLSERDEV